MNCCLEWAWSAASGERKPVLRWVWSSAAMLPLEPLSLEKSVRDCEMNKSLVNFHSLARPRILTRRKNWHSGLMLSLTYMIDFPVTNG